MVRNHSLFRTESAYEEAETKKAMGDWKPPMALIFNSYSYDGIGQTSLSMFAQHHQLPCFVKLSIRSSSNQIRCYLTNSSLTCQVFFEHWFNLFSNRGTTLF